MPADTFEFHGAKLALFLGEDLLVYLRDDFEGLPWAGYWDLPGGGREGTETPEETVLRETYEEFTLSVPPEALTYRRLYGGDDTVVFFAAHLDATWQDQIVFGNEGQRWEMWTPNAFLTNPRAVPMLKVRLRDYLNDRR